MPNGDDPVHAWEVDLRQRLRTLPTQYQLAVAAAWSGHVLDAIAIHEQPDVMASLRASVAAIWSSAAGRGAAQLEDAWTDLDGIIQGPKHPLVAIGLTDVVEAALGRQGVEGAVRGALDYCISEILYRVAAPIRKRAGGVIGMRDWPTLCDLAWADRTMAVEREYASCVVSAAAAMAASGVRPTAEEFAARCPIAVPEVGPEGQIGWIRLSRP